MKTNKFHISFCILVALVSLISCKKQTIEEKPTTGNNGNLQVSNAVIHANFITPDSVAGILDNKWGKISYDLSANKVNGDSVLLSFDGNLCREIHAGNGYTLRYADISETSLSSIGLSQILAANLNAIDSSATAGKPNDVKQTWFTYSNGKQYGMIPVKDRYLILFKGDSFLKTSVLYVIQLNNIEYIPGQMSGYYFGGIKFDYKRLI
jgi:hypothetical protein